MSALYRTFEGIKRGPVPAAHLACFRMKCGLLTLHPLYQFLDPVECLLIRHAGRYETVMLDPLVDLNALLTHGPPFQRPPGHL
jgi:hypothetical protein